ncbi:protocadherin Fat 3-like isoform X1 [Haliotis rubra]|uniref:protocadherin Fat 3-like isoform X1 n=2 Tax=Haliotis rubra TaxID=36100 RepID=UPI001EE53814|nr:protocadherin Fat 3-like isoform X1 [Haliotis rubra]
METVRLGLLVTVLCFIPFRQAAIPVWGYVPPVVILSEDTPIGTLLLNLTAEGNDITILTASDDTAMLVNVSETVSSDNVTYYAKATLASELDRDFEPYERRIFFSADSPGFDAVTISTLLRITDVNDNPPSFVNKPYRCEPLENVDVGEVIFSGVSAPDPDMGPTVDFTLVPDSVTDGIFGVNKTGEFTADIFLVQSLDYEKRNAYTVTIAASDQDGLNDTTTLEVLVQDVQDTPPFFLFDVYRAAVVENSPADTSVIQVQAEDGDRGVPNSVEYAIIEGNTELFFIDATSGVITTKQSLDREAPDVIDVNGVFDLLVQATELNETWPQYGNITKTVNVYATVEDVNDNAPTFNTSTPYTAFVRSDIPDNSLIYFEGDGYMQVYDNDQTGKSATFVLSIEQGGQLLTIFEPSPREVFSEANVLIRVVDASALRALGQTHVTFEVIAREVNTAENFFGKASVVLTIEKVEEPSTTAAPLEENTLTTSDIVVFVVGFLVLLNVLTSVTICFLMRARSRKEGLNRTGSKYYIKNRPTNDFTNHGLHNPSTTEMVEVDPEISVCPRVGNGEFAE